jgi:hypothetical protein
MVDAQQGAIAQLRGDVITAKAIAKSGRVLYAFSQFYLPFYEKDPADLFWHYDPFAWISAFTYDIDEQVETGNDPENALRRIEHLLDYLRERITIDSKVVRLFDDARRYYRFEYHVGRGGAGYTLDDLIEITSVRSFDFRLMHRTLAQLTSVGYREELFDWFRAFEMLMEIEDDMGSIEEDDARSSFNIAVFAHRLSPETASKYVQSVREQVERDTELRLGTLTEVEQDLCKRTMTAYRLIVPTPVLLGETPSRREIS